MSEYQSPLRELSFVIDELCAVPEQLGDSDRYIDCGLGADLTKALLVEAARFAENALGPLRRSADIEGVRCENNAIVLPSGFAEALQEMGRGGWMGISANPQYGGQGLPEIYATAVFEMWNSANMAFGLGPMLTTGAALAIEHHGSEEQKKIYLGQMYSGEWAGTMNLTESSAGSDLGLIKTRAVPDGDHYRLYGQKIFITWGDHEATDNIIHLVLARLPDAPEGSRGISLFIVPKYLADEQGEHRVRNDVFPVSNEHKLGIHGSPTCVMSFGDKEGAVGYLLGREHEGLRCMFTMMNEARLKVGVQGLGVAEAAYQQALSYAGDRVQAGKAIAEHPDVYRMLMTMSSATQAMRALSYSEAVTLDRANNCSEHDQRKKYQSRIDLLIPVIKGWLTELGTEVASLGIQVHGGMGYIEETGAAQYLRDVRISSIYEGTNGIQAADLVGRKLAADGGAAIAELLLELVEEANLISNSGNTQLQVIAKYLLSAAADMELSTQTILDRLAADPSCAMLSSFDYMMEVGYLLGGWQMLRSASIAEKNISAGSDDPFYVKKLVDAGFYARHLLPRATAHKLAIMRAESLL